MTIECKDVNAQGHRIVWDWAPWARFLGARAQLIHEYAAEGQGWEQIAKSLSCDPGQAQLIGSTELSGICGIPGAVWPPVEFQTAEAVEPVADPQAVLVELQKHQDLVEALQWLPAGTVVDFCDLDDYLEEMRGPPWNWRPRRECSHVFRDSDECVHCGIDVEELKGGDGG